MENIAQNLGFWFWIAAVIGLIVMGYFVVIAPLIRFSDDFYREKNAASTEEQRALVFKRGWSRALRLTFIDLIFIAFVIGIFVAFGPGIQDSPSMPEEEGRYQLNSKAPDEKPIEVIEQEAEEKQPAALKQVRKEGFEEERQEADDYIQQALDRAKERQGNK